MIEIRPRGRVERHPLVDGTSAWWKVDRIAADQGVVTTALRNSTRFGNSPVGDYALWLWLATPCACACHQERRELHLQRLASANGREQPSDLLELLAATS